MSDQQASEPKRRRKDARPDEILQAAFQEFTTAGFAATRLDDIARRAHVSKGTIYRYFASKEELFEALLRQSMTSHLEHVAMLVETFPGSMEAFLRGPFRAFQQAVLGSETKHLIRLLVAEAHAFPELTTFYYREVIEPGLEVLRRIVARGVARGEFRPTALERFPQALVAPAVVGLLWKALFDHEQDLDIDGLLDTHLDLILHGLLLTR